MNRQELLATARKIVKTQRDDYLEEKLEQYNELKERKAPINKVVNQINERVIKLLNRVENT